jgi:uncharacterized protein YjbJ (UPF0337 family)
MNRDQIDGGLRNIKGRGQSALGAVTGRVRPQAEGAFEQAAGAVQYAYGRARDAADDLQRDGEHLVDEARHRGRAFAEDLQERGRAYQDEAVRRGRAVANRADENKGTTLLLVAVAAFGAGWLLRRAG